MKYLPEHTPPDEWLPSERLVLRAPAQGDLPALQMLHADAQVMRYVDRPFSGEQTRTWLDAAIGARAAGPGLGDWVVDQRDGERCIGVVSLRRFADGPHAALAPQLAPALGCPLDRVLELGWRFHVRHWGKTYAAECGGALLRHAFERHAAAAVCAVTLTDNRASCRAIAKCGLEALAGDFALGERAVRVFARRAPASAEPGNPPITAM